LRNKCRSLLCSHLTATSLKFRRELLIMNLCTYAIRGCRSKEPHDFFPCTPRRPAQNLNFCVCNRLLTFPFLSLPFEGRISHAVYLGIEHTSLPTLYLRSGRPRAKVLASLAPLDIQPVHNDPYIDIAEGAQPLVLGRDDSVTSLSATDSSIQLVSVRQLFVMVRSKTTHDFFPCTPRRLSPKIKFMRLQSSCLCLLTLPFLSLPFAGHISHALYLGIGHTSLPTLYLRRPPTGESSCIPCTT